MQGVLTNPAPFKVFVSSPYSGETNDEVLGNLQFAAYVGSVLVKNGLMPMVPHLYFTVMLDDNNEEQRRLGMLMSQAWIKESTVFLSLLPEGRTEMSEGMKEEWNKAQEVFPQARIFTSIDDLFAWLNNELHAHNEEPTAQEVNDGE